ncbi:MAG: type VII toxin-antitoxin system HepT family RNase toxin [Thermoanaerobaculia bacterium]
MTDPELVEKKLALVETCVRQLRTIARPAQIRSDIREERFVEHTLQVAVQSVLDVASHIVSDERLGEPQTNRELFDLLARGGVVEPALADVLRDMAGFRNVLVHGYQDVNLGVLEDILANHLDDLLDFVKVVRVRMET